MLYVKQDLWMPEHDLHIMSITEKTKLRVKGGNVKKSVSRW